MEAQTVFTPQAADGRTMLFTHTHKGVQADKTLEISIMKTYETLISPRICHMVCRFNKAIIELYLV